VNFAGITFFHRLSQETNATVEELVRAHVVCREVYGVDRLLDSINALDNKVEAAVQTRMRLSVRTLVERACRWLVNNRRPPLDSEATVDHFGTQIQHVMEALPDIVRGVEADSFARQRDELMEARVPDEVATAVAALPMAYAALEVVEIARRDQVDALDVARVHAVLGDRLGLSHVLAKIVRLPREDRWQTMARAALRDDLHAAHAALTAQVLATTDEDGDLEQRVSVWEQTEQTLVQRAKQTLAEITSDDQADLARMSVALRVVRTMLTTA